MSDETPETPTPTATATLPLSRWSPGEDVVQVQRPPARGAARGAWRTFVETARGLKTTFGRIAEGPNTIQYPEEKVPVYPRFRGRHKLHRFEDTGPGEVRGLLAVRGRVPRGLHPRGRRGEHA